MSGASGEMTLASAIRAALARRGWRLAVAESCTGGLVAKLLTDVPGISEVFAGGVVAYANEVKHELLGVDLDLLERRGAVSAEVAAAMAAGVRRACGVELGLAVTGIAGPEGGSPEKPVGLVHLALDGPAGALERTLRLPGDRHAIRMAAATAALELVRRHVEPGGDS